MKKVNKIVSLLTATALLATMALSGCSGKDNKSNSSGSGAETPSTSANKYDYKDNVKITLFQSKVEIVDQLEELAEKYKEETGAEVEVWGASGDDYYQQVKTKLTSNQGPTVFSVAPGSEAEQLKAYLEDLSNQEYVKNIAPNLELKADNKTVGIPYGIEGYGLVYNKDLVKPEDISTLESFTAFMKKMKDQKINGLSLSKEDYFLIAHILNTPFAMQENPTEFVEKVNKGEVKLAETKEFIEFAKYMEAIRDNNINPLEVKYDDQTGGFAMGTNAMIHQGNWCYSMFEDYKDDMKFEYSMMPFPLLNNDKISIGVASYWVVNSQKTDDEKKAANDFIDWLLNSETGKDYIVNKFGFLPAMTNIEVKDADPLSRAVLDASNSGKSIPWTYNNWPAGIVANDLAPATQAFFIDKNMTGMQLLQKLDTAWANATK